MISNNRFQEQISKWQVLSKSREEEIKQLEQFKEKSLKDEALKHELERITELLKKVPLYYQGKTWAHFKEDYPNQSQIKAITKRYVRSIKERLQDGNNLIFFGRPGTGKTLLSLIIYQQLIQSGLTCCYEPSLDFLRMLQNKKFVSNTDFLNVMKHYHNIPFLIIDEITEGSGKDRCLTDWEKSLLFNLINGRYQNKCCTLIISNRTHLEIRTRLTEPTFDRLSENGLLLGFNWKSYRQ